MLCKTSELTGPALDWAVAQCEGVHIENIKLAYCHAFITPVNTDLGGGDELWSPSTIWSQAGPIIEREKIAVAYFKADRMHPEPYVIASAISTDYADENSRWASGPTELIAVMRCYVASKLGDEVEIPDELCKD